MSRSKLDAADVVLREIEEMGEQSFIPSIGPVKGKILARAVKQAKPKRILEVGALYGYSSILMAKNAPDAKIITIEKSKQNVEITMKNVKRAGMTGRIRVIHGEAREVLPKLLGPFDLVFLDAEKGQYFQYLKAVENKLHRGSIIVADNVGIFKEEMLDYLDYVRNKGPYKSRTVETFLEFSNTTKDAMEISEKL